ncbi:MAG: hypothetical protein ACKV2T_01215 [Kofleriaceae bacterium]
MSVATVATLMIATGACFTRPDLKSRDDGGTVGDGSVDDAPIDACLPAQEPPVPTLTRLTFDQVSAGQFHVCAIDTAGDLWCWGSNDHAQLGDRQDSPGAMTGVPGRASPAITGWTAVSASADHSCGIANNRVYCWGRNDSHQSHPMGTGDPIFPTEVAFTGILPPGEIPTKVFAGPTASCAITSLNRAICWGDTDLTVGASTVAPKLLSATNGTSEWSTIAIAEDHACALSTTGHIYCWGESDALQLGVSTAPRTFAQLAQRDSTVFQSIAIARDVTCATRSSDGQLVCFGSAGAGHLGNTSGVSVNRDVSGVNADRIALGRNHVCYRDMTSSVFCYGDSTEGALGTGVFQGNRSPTTSAAQNAVQIVAGEGFSCALDTNDELSCWGNNAHGELGVGNVATKRDPTLGLLPVGTCEAVLQIASGDRHTCAIVKPAADTAGRLYCWGNNSQRQVNGTSNELSIARPLHIFPAETFSRVATGEMHSCALRSDGAVRCWGDNSSGQIGIVASSNGVIMPIDGMPWTFVAAGSRASCAIRASGDLYCWGDVPTVGPRSTPTNYMRPTNKFWSTIALGSGFGIGTTIDPAAPNRVFVYGFAPNGCQVNSMVGASITDPSPLYLDEHLRVNVTGAQANGGHVCIHMNLVNGTNKVTCFGRNDSNQCSPMVMGCVTYEDVAAPPGGWRMAFQGVSTVTASRTHSCALSDIGRVWCWGANNASELGNLPGMNMNPAEVTDVRFAEISTGADHTCGIGENRTNISCWGENRYGQLGNDARFHATATAAGLVP